MTTRLMTFSSLQCIHGSCAGCFPSGSLLECSAAKEDEVEYSHVVRSWHVVSFHLIVPIVEGVIDNVFQCLRSHNRESGPPKAASQPKRYYLYVLAGVFAVSQLTARLPGAWAPITLWYS